MIHRALRQSACTLVAMVLVASAATSSSAQTFSARNGSSVTLGARVQAQYEVPGPSDAPSTFFIRRAWVTIDGSLNDLVGGRLQFDAQGSTTLEAYLALTPSESFQLQIGQFKRAVSYFWLAANADLPLIERDGRVTGISECPGVGGVCSFGKLTFGLGLDGYEPGILATGRFANRRLGYRVTLTNGEGISKKDVNGGKSASGRLSYFFAGNSRLSAYAAMDETLGSDEQTMRVPAYGMELEVGTWRNGPHLLVNGTTGRNWKVNDDAGFSAFQVMGLWYVPLAEERAFAAVEPLFRLSWARTEDADGMNVSGLVVTPGVMLYAAGRNGISANLDLYRTIEDQTEWSFKIQAFTFF